MHSDEQLPAAIGRFHVRSRLGRGLHGEVFLAHDPHLERDVAVKLLHPRRATSAADGIPDEARILANLRHPNIVSVFEAGLHEGEPFYVMEYVRGTTLRDLLTREHRLSGERALHIMAPVLAGMAHAHAAGVSHLDLSPANVLMDRNGVPRLMDFGLSRRADRAAETSDLLVGTPRYMAPEHFDFSGLRPHTDVYALGLMLFEMLTGHPVVIEERIEQVARVVCDMEPDWSMLRARRVEPALEAVLRVALAKRPEARYADAAAMLTALAPLVPEAPPGDRHATVAFLLHRMQRKQDFPALSRNLGEINRLTAPDSLASTRHLANVVLRDYAVSSKLLKLANSAYYGNIRGSIANISDAITLLGFERVRATCNGLMYFSHFDGQQQDSALLDTLISSFVCGLMARHVASRMGLKEVEDAFLCGLFRGLGRSLAIYYFADEYREISAAVSAGGDETEAARAVLGLAYDELAVAVAREWKFPDSIVDSLLPAPAGALPKPQGRAAALAAASGYAYGLVQIAALPPGLWRDAMLEGHVDRFAECVADDTWRARELLAAALVKFRDFAPVLGVPSAQSRFLPEACDLAGCEAMQKFEALAEQADAPPADGARRVPAAAQAGTRRKGLLGRTLQKLGRSGAGV